MMICDLLDIECDLIESCEKGLVKCPHYSNESKTEI